MAGIVSRRITLSNISTPPGSASITIQSSSPSVVTSWTVTTVGHGDQTRRVTVHLNPEDIARVEASGGTQQLTSFSVLQVDVVPDPALGHGDCMVETDFGMVDGRLNTRLDELRRTVATAMEGEAA